MGGISFLSPWWLIGLPLVAGGLVYIYRRKASQKTRIVSTLLLLKDFTKASVERAKVELPLRFFLELLTLSLLVLLLARIHSGSVGKKIAIVIDDSFSTQALGRDGGPLYASIKKQAQEYIESTSVQDTFDLYRSGRTLPVAQGISGGEALDQIEADPTEFLHTDQLLTVVQAAAGTGYDKVHVFTDKEIQNVTRSTSLVVSSVRDELKTKNNVAVEKTFFNPADSRVHVVLRSFASNVQSGSVELAPDIRKNFEIDPDDTIELTLQRPAGDKKEGEITLTTEPSGADALLQDNRSTLSFNPPASDKIFVVSDLPDDSLGLSGITSYVLSHVKTQEYAKNPEGFNGKAVVFHRFAPEVIPSQPALYILPGESKLFQSKGVFSNLSVTRWESSHPITTYLHMDLFSASQGQTFNPLPWQQVIMSTEEGPILLAGENGGFRSVVSGFEIFPFRGKDAPLSSIMTLNALKWISDGDSSARDAKGFFSEEESNLYSNVLNVGNMEPPVAPKQVEAKNMFRMICLLLLIAVCIADLVYALLKGHPAGSKT